MYLTYFMSGIVLRAPLVPEQSQQYCLRGTRNPELAPSALFVHFIDTARPLLQYLPSSEGERTSK